MTRRGFTLLELTLATVIGAMVLLVAGGLFVAMGRAEATFARAHERANEMALTQSSIRRAFARLVMAPNDTAVREGEVDTRRPRVLLTDDPAAGGDGVPRFEVVVSRAPVAATLAGPAAGWAFADEDRASLNFVSADGSGGQVRGVFELRRDGQRERVMRALGVAGPLWGPAASDEPEQGRAGWTLWWRRMPADEVAQLEDGRQLWRDGDGDEELEAKRLAGAIRLARGLTGVEWQVFKSDAWTAVYGGITVQELPAYLKLKLRTVEGDFAEWLFEVEWTTSETVGTDTQAYDLLGLDENGEPVADTGDTGTDDAQQDDEPTADDRPGQTGGQDDGPTAGDGRWGDSSSGGRSKTFHIGGGNNN